MIVKRLKNTGSYGCSLVIYIFDRPTKASGYVTNVRYHPSWQLKSLQYMMRAVMAIDINARLLSEKIAVQRSGNTYLNMAYQYDGTNNV